MWVVVWSEHDIEGPYATETQARAQATKDGNPLHCFGTVVRVHAPSDPEYNRDLTLHGILIRDD